MLLASGDFYVSGTFWAGVGSVVAVALSTIVIVSATGHFSNPKRRLLYWMPDVTPLLNSGRADLSHDLEVRHNGHLLSEPHVVEVELVSRGRLDIPSSAFDQGKPLRMDVNAKIIDLLKVTTMPVDRANPDFSINGSSLHVGPSLISKGQITVFSLLVDGPLPFLTCNEPSLIDVDVHSLERKPSIAQTTIAIVVVGWALLRGKLVGTTGEVEAEAQTRARSKSRKGRRSERRKRGRFLVTKQTPATAYLRCVQDKEPNYTARKTTDCDTRCVCASIARVSGDTQADIRIYPRRTRMLSSCWQRTIRYALTVIPSESASNRAESATAPCRVWRWAIIRHGWGFFREDRVHQKSQRVLTAEFAIGV